VLSYLVTPSGVAHSGAINALISVVAISATTYLVLRIEQAQAATDEARAQLAHVSRVTTLGELTASIAHEVNQPLTAVVTNGNAGLRWLAASPPNHDEAGRALERIVKEANRASDIVGRIRNLARRAPAATVRFDLADTILATVALVQSQAQRHAIVLRTEIEADLPAIRGDHVQVQQVILNLLVNAIEALAHAQGPAREARIGARCTGSVIEVTIADSGKGFGAAGDRVFDAFYSTKPDGLGMGLAIARSIVESHGGTIWVGADPLGGALVGFSLPLPSGAAASPDDIDARST
jgi:signal transduction histidine kinase